MIRHFIHFLTFKSKIVKQPTTLLFALVASFALIMTACSKTGPAGAAGATGATGATGPQGPSGTDSGMYSAWIPISMTMTLDTVGDTAWVDTVSASALTGFVLDQYVVVGYIQSVDAAGDTTIVNAASLLDETFGTGYIELYSDAPGIDATQGYNYTGYNYRYMIIPADIQITSSSGVKVTYTRAQLEKMDYPTLTALFHIPSKGSFLKLETPN
jgi:hypothetical protein